MNMIGKVSSVLQRCYDLYRLKSFYRNYKITRQKIQRFLNTDLSFSEVENCMNIWTHLKHVYIAIIIHFYNEGTCNFTVYHAYKHDDDNHDLVWINLVMVTF
jgi:hypothetical protein